jgi:biotin transport system substrate-specific component
MALGSLTLFAFGLAWLSRFTGWPGVLAAGFWPFVPGDLLKQALAALLLPAAWKLAGRAQPGVGQGDRSR